MNASLFSVDYIELFTNAADALRQHPVVSGSVKEFSR